MDKVGRMADATGPSQAEPVVSALRASVPCAERIERAVKRALEPLNNPDLNWQVYHRRLQETPSLVLHNLRESNVLFRLPEQADWPLVIEAYSSRPYSLTIRTQLTIGGQTFGVEQMNDDRLLYTALPHDLATHLGRQAIRATLEAVGEPFYEAAARNIAQAIEARRAETLGSVHESAVPQECAQGDLS